MDIVNSGPKALGDEVRKGRLRLQFATSKDFADAIGVTPRLVGDIENGRRVSYSPKTLSAIDRALGWPSGTSQIILEGTGESSLAQEQGSRSVFTAEGVSVVVEPDRIQVTITVPKNEKAVHNATGADLIGGAYRAREEFQEALYKLARRSLGRGVGMLVPEGEDFDFDALVNMTESSGSVSGVSSMFDPEALGLAAARDSRDEDVDFD